MNRFQQLKVSVGLWLLLGATVLAQAQQPRIGMEKSEVLRQFSAYVISQSPDGTEVTLKMPFFGCPANVFVGFSDYKAHFISVSFTSFLTKEDRSNRLALFKEVRRQLQDLSGSEYSYARIDDIDVLGESGGWITDRNRRNAFVFGKDHEDVRYHLEIFAEAASDLAANGEARLTVVRKESTQLPTAPPSQNAPLVGALSPAKP